MVQSGHVSLLLPGDLVLSTCEGLPPLRRRRAPGSPPPRRARMRSRAGKKPSGALSWRRPPSQSVVSRGRDKTKSLMVFCCPCSRCCHMVSLLKRRPASCPSCPSAVSFVLALAVDLPTSTSRPQTRLMTWESVPAPAAPPQHLAVSKIREPFLLSDPRHLQSPGWGTCCSEEICTCLCT